MEHSTVRMQNTADKKKLGAFKMYEISEWIFITEKCSEELERTAQDREQLL